MRSILLPRVGSFKANGTSGLLWAFAVLALIQIATWGRDALWEREWKKEADKLIAVAHKASVRADSLQFAILAQTKADSIKADSIARKAASLAVERNALRARLAKAVAAQSVEQVAEVAEEALDNADNTAVQLNNARSIIERQQRSIASLSATVDTLQAINRNLAEVIKSAPVSKDRRFGIGIFAGQCVGAWGTGPCVGFGVVVRAI